MNFYSTRLAFRCVYTGALAYTLASCTASYPSKLYGVHDDSKFQTTERYLLKEQDNVRVAIQSEGVVRDMVGFSVEVANYSEEPIRVKPQKFYALSHLEGATTAPTQMYALDPEQKIAEMNKRIQNRIEAGKAGRTFLIVLGVVLIVGIIVVAMAESSKNGKATSTNKPNGTPRGGNGSNSSSASQASYREGWNNRPRSCGTGLQTVGQVVDITTTTLLNSHYNQEMAIENLAYIKGLWENEALREVTLQPQEKVTGTIFFPRAILKGKSIHIHLPILSTEHTFLFRRD